MAIGIVVALIVVGIVLAYQWTQSHYFVGAENGTVAIYRGVQQDLGPIHLSSVFETTKISVADLPASIASRSGRPSARAISLSLGRSSIG